MKWVRKSVLSVLSVVLLAGLLAACSNGEEGSVDEDGNWTGTITIWDGPRWPDEDENKYHWLEAKAAEYEEANEGIEIEIVQVPWAEMGDKLGVAIAGQSWPDIAPVDISGSAVSIDHIEQGVVEPLDELYTEDELSDFYDNAVEAYTFNDKLYGIPNSITVHSMLLNLDLFEEAGVEPPADGKWTWDEFVETAEGLTFDRDGDGEIDVHGFSTYILEGYYEAWPLFYKDGGRPLSDDLSEFTFNSPEAVKAIQDVADLKLELGVAPETLGGNDVGGTFQAWANEEQRTVAMEPWATWAIQSAQSAYPTNFMVAEYPVGESGKPVTIGGVGGWIMFGQDSDPKKEAVGEFMKYLSSTDEQYTMATEYGIFPARKSTADMDPYAENPQMARAQEMTKDVVMLPRHPEWKKIDEIIQGKLQVVFNGEKTAQEAMDEAQEQIEDLLSE
ncbi:extracellular solute-binding protein [Filobacillus milosensis]|uniref:Extracellular solute-binding protein n=1 Tax=Filobacillus milosensis TaxID=94137 RepID=A0A4Y8ITL8_9BACI|nr:extracellular solute-binding protein [Filobacillus milosensis]TFB24412.1 extracellular solute-binding protein [Filobacillus milosensis]